MTGIHDLSPVCLLSLNKGVFNRKNKYATHAHAGVNWATNLPVLQSKYVESLAYVSKYSRILLKLCKQNILLRWPLEIYNLYLPQLYTATYSDQNSQQIVSRN